MAFKNIQGAIFLVIASFVQFIYADNFNITTPVNAVYVQHRETKLFIGKNGQLYPNVKDAQGFLISLADARGNIVFEVKKGGKVLKVVKCRFGQAANLSLEIAPIDDNTFITEEEYFLTVNNDYSLGSRCGKDLLVVPDKNKKRLVAQSMDQCRNKMSTAFEFINVNTLKIDDPEPGVDTVTVGTE